MASDTRVKITYEALYDVLLREKQRDALQPLDPPFWTDSLEYLREKQEMLDSTRNKVDLFSAAEREKTQQQLRNVRRILKEIYDRREKKILDIAINKSRTGSKMIDTSNQLDIERQMFEALVNEMNFFRQGLLNNILDLRDPAMYLEGESKHSEILSAKPSVPAGMILVKLSIDVAQFVGPELDVYGPYSAGDTAILPEEIAKILINQGSASVEATPQPASAENEPPEPDLAEQAGLDEFPNEMPEAGQDEPIPTEPEINDPEPQGIEAGQ